MVELCRKKKPSIMSSSRQDDPLALGMVDALAAVGIPAFGPDKAAARIEASKVFSKDLMKKYGIPTAKYETFDDPEKVMAYITGRGQVPASLSRRTAWRWARAC